MIENKITSVKKRFFLIKDIFIQKINRINYNIKFQNISLAYFALVMTSRLYRSFTLVR